MSLESPKPQMKSPDGGNRQGLESVNVTHQGNVTMNMVPQFGADASLVPVTEGEIGSIVQPVVNARELHRFLKVRRDFTTWIKGRIQKYGFVQDQDFVLTLTKTGERQNVVQTDYFLAIDMAKELSMVENNAQGRQVRRYFIECERAIAQVNQSLLFQFNRAMLEFEKFADMASDAGRTLNIVGKQYKPEALQRMNSLKSKIQPGLPLDVLS